MRWLVGERTELNGLRLGNSHVEFMENRQRLDPAQIRCINRDGEVDDSVILVRTSQLVHNCSKQANFNIL